MLNTWRQWWRLFLLAWLTLAIPTQGFAAATKVLCPHHLSGHRSPAQATPAHTTHTTHAGHTAHAPHGEHHGDHHAKATQCSACGTCCAALGMPEQVLAAFQPPLVDATLPAGSPRLSLSFLTDGPERPPKALHA
jgi:hypothetical protein